MATSFQNKAPVVAGADQLAQQCKHEVNYSTLVSRGEFAWNVFYDGKLVGSFLDFERANALALVWVMK